MYQALDTIKNETSNKSVQEIADGRACVGAISCGYHAGENCDQILSRVALPPYSLGGILPQECFSGQEPMDLHFGTK